MSLTKHGSFRSLAASRWPAGTFHFEVVPKDAQMSESDRPGEGQPTETPVVGEAEGKAREPRFAFLQRVLREAGIGIALLLMIVIFSSFARHFTDESNITNILTQVTINLIMATGMTFVILIGGIDLSVGSMLAFAAMVAGLGLKSATLPVPAAITPSVLTRITIAIVCRLAHALIL